MTLPPGLPPLDAQRPVLIAGPTASGKSELALRIAERWGGEIVNADASQVYGCWQVVTARPGPDDLARAPHRLFGHVDWRVSYSVGHWLRDVAPVLRSGARPIVVGGTGLFLSALTRGLAEIPPVAPETRAAADAMDLADLVAGLDAETAGRIDLANRARVQRAWEVLRQTGRGLARWQADTPAPLLARGDVCAVVLDAGRDWLEPRISGRFDAMLAGGALEEVAAMLPFHDPALPAFRAIGVPELAAHLRGQTDRDTARAQAVVATRQYAKRQRTWFRARMRDWTWIDPEF